MNDLGAYLVLRKTSPSGWAHKLFTQLTKWRLVTKYPHAGMVIDGVLYQSTFAKGVHSISFESNGWDLYECNIDKNELKSRFESVKGAKYDWFSLFAFVLPFKIYVVQSFYCYELSYFMLTGKKTTLRVTPEDLLRITYATNQSARNKGFKLDN